MLVVAVWLSRSLGLESSGKKSAPRVVTVECGISWMDMGNDDSLSDAFTPV